MFWTTWISFSTDSHRFIFSLIYLISWHEPFTEEVSPWLKVPQVTFRMNSAFLCAHIWTFIIFTVAQRASCAWWTGGNKSAVVYCRWLHSTAASHSAALLSFCKCPLTLTPPLPTPHPFLYGSTHILSLSPSFSSFSNHFLFFSLMDVSLYCMNMLVKNQQVFQKHSLRQ